MIPRQHDAHLVPWLKARFNITIEPSIYSFDFVAYEGEYDLDICTATGYSVFDAAMTYANWYNGKLADKLDDVEVGR